MRFLTSAWHSGQLTDSEAEAAEAALRTRQDRIRPRLAAPVQELMDHVNLHDALLCQARLNRSKRTLDLFLLGGDAPRGYFDLALHYQGLDLDAMEAESLARIAENPEAEALYTEIDLDDKGRCVHRWLWWPYAELDITFESLEFGVVPRADRNPRRATEPYVESSGDAG